MYLAALIGISINDFWEMTLAELNIYIRAYAENKENTRDLYIYQAYLISRWVWAKKLNINEVLKKKKREPMSDEEMFKVVKNLNAALGGEVK